MYQLTTGLALVLCCIIILLVPVLILRAIKSTYIKDKEVCDFLSLYESSLILWWFINFLIINAFGPHLSTGVIIMEVVYALITLWFFVFIPIKTWADSSYVIVSNPLVFIIILLTVILVLCILLCILLVVLICII